MRFKKKKKKSLLDSAILIALIALKMHKVFQTLLIPPALCACGCGLSAVLDRGFVCPALWPAARAALPLASCLPPCLASALCCSPLASEAGNFPGVTSLLREQHSSRTAISYNPNKRPCVLLWLLFKSREGADRWRPKLHKCPTEVSTQGQFLHCIKPGSHVDRHLAGAATFPGGGRLPRPLKKCFLEHVIWAVFPVHRHLAEGQHRYPAVRLLHPVPLAS